jgi:hypothetical protein
VPEEPSIAGVAPATARKGGRGRGRAGGAGGKFHSGCASPAKARAREEAPKLPRQIAQNAAPRYLFPARETIQPLLEEDTARARGKTSVILALRYFSAAAGDALTELELQLAPSRCPGGGEGRVIGRGHGPG